MKIGDLMRSPLDQMGVQLPGPIGGYGGGTFNTDGTQATPVDPSGDLADLLGLKPQKREGWKNIAGTILDVVAAASGYKPQYWSGVADEKSQYDDFQQRMAVENFKSRQRLEEQRMKAMQPPEPTAMERNFQYWNSLDPQQREAFAQYQDTVQPKFFTGPDGRPYPQQRGGLPQGYDPNEWEVVPGGAGSGQPGFLGQ